MAGIADQHFGQVREEINALKTAWHFAATVTALDHIWTTSRTDECRRFVLELTRAAKTGINHRSVEAAFVQLLPEVLTFARSPFGFLAEVEYSPSGEPYLQSHAVTDVYKPDFTIHDILSRLQFHNLETLNGAVMTSCEPVLTNDPPNDPRSGGVPFGHQALHAYLGIPFMVEGEIVGAIALGNCSDGYTETDLERLAPLCEVGGKLIADYRQL